MAAYTDADIEAGVMAAGDRGSCQHERSLRRSGIDIRCDRCDAIAVLDAIAPAIAARALRDFADWAEQNGYGRVQSQLRDRADEIERTP